jgi:methylphosphotriester-DNA--protein-cysteine methyltransferase
MAGILCEDHLERLGYKSLAPDGTPCRSDSQGLLQRYPVAASACRLIGKETERGWEQPEDISTLLPSLKRYERNTGTANQLLQERLQRMSLNALQTETGLSRNTILRARRREQQLSLPGWGTAQLCWAECSQSCSRLHRQRQTLRGLPSKSSMHPWAI